MAKKTSRKKLSPTSFTRGDLAKLSKTATAQGTPSTAMQALRPAPLKVASLTLAPPSLDTLLQLEAAKSPFLLGGEVAVKDVALALYILSADPDEVDAVLEHPGELLAAARRVARQVPLAELPALAARLKAHIDGAFATAVRTAPETEDQKKTASAGS